MTKYVRRNAPVVVEFNGTFQALQDIIKEFNFSNANVHADFDKFPEISSVEIIIDSESGQNIQLKKGDFVVMESELDNDIIKKFNKDDFNKLYKAIDKD